MPDVVVVGSFVQDLAFSAEQFPAPGESRIGSFTAGPGGKGFNQAIAARRLGLDTMFIGALGTDIFAATARDFAEREKLRCGFELISEAATGAASIIVNAQAQNLIVVAPGANDHLSTQHIDQYAHEISACKVMLCQLESNLTATAHALRLAHRAEATTILDPAPINDAIDVSLLDDVDILVPNETEFAFLSERLFDRKLPKAYWTQPQQELHDACRATGVPTVIVTLGTQGAFVSHGPDAPRHHASLDNYFVGPADVNPVDTTGAGDAFNGGLAAGIVRFGVNRLNVACQYASQVAGLSTETAGTARSMPNAELVENRFG